MEGIEPDLLKSGDDRTELIQFNSGTDSPTDKIDVLKFLKDAGSTKVNDNDENDGQEADEQEVIVSDLDEEMEIIEDTDQ